MILDRKFKRNINHTYYGSRSSKKRLIKRFNKKLKLEQKYQDKRQEKHIKKKMKMEQKNEKIRARRDKSKIRKILKFIWK
jgi:hypothetical protein